MSERLARILAVLSAILTVVLILTIITMVSNDVNAWTKTILASVVFGLNIIGGLTILIVLLKIGTVGSVAERMIIYATTYAIIMSILGLFGFWGVILMPVWVLIAFLVVAVASLAVTNVILTRRALFY